jgi:hypothetical protein
MNAVLTPQISLGQPWGEEPAPLTSHFVLSMRDMTGQVGPRDRRNDSARVQRPFLVRPAARAGWRGAFIWAMLVICCDGSSNSLSA